METSDGESPAMAGEGLSKRARQVDPAAEDDEIVIMDARGPAALKGDLSTPTD